MKGTLPSPSDAKTFTMLVGRATFRVPRDVRFTDLGGGNYAGYLMHYQTFGGRPMRAYLEAQAKQYNGPVRNQHPELAFDDARHRAVLTYDSDEMRHMEMYQDLGDGGALTFEADYRTGAKGSAESALTALADDLVPVRPGEPIPQGMGMGDSVLARSVLNDEVANANVEFRLPGYAPGDHSGLSVELISEMAGHGGDAMDAPCHNGQLSQFDLGGNDSGGPPSPVTRTLLRYRERNVAGIVGGETAELQTANDGSFRQVELTFMTDPEYPPAGQPTLTIRGSTQDLNKGNDLRQTLAVWDGILDSAQLAGMPGPARGVFQQAPPGYKEQPPCRQHADVNLAFVKGGVK